MSDDDAAWEGVMAGLRVRRDGGVVMAQTAAEHAEGCRRRLAYLEEHHGEAAREIRVLRAMIAAEEAAR